MIQVGEGRCGNGGRIEQRSHQGVLPAVGRDDTNQAHARRAWRAAEVRAIPGVRGADVDPSLGETGAQEASDGGEAAVVDAHTEGDFALSEDRHQPAGRIAAIEHEQVAGRESLEVFEQHLALAAAGRMEFEREAHLEARQVERECDGFPHLAPGGVLEEQHDFRGIRSDDPKPPPARDRQVRLEQREQAPVQQRKDAGGEFLPGLREGLRADLAHQVRLLLQVRKKGVELVLKAGFEAGEEECDERRKGQLARAAEGIRIEANGVEQFSGAEVLAKPNQDCQKFSSSLYSPYQSVN